MSYWCASCDIFMFTSVCFLLSPKCQKACLSCSNLGTVAIDPKPFTQDC